MELLFQFNFTEVLIVIFAGILILLGLIGCIAPILPGPILSFFGLLIMQLREEPPFSTNLMIILAAATLIVILLDYILPFISAKFAGASKYGQWGSMIGLVFGLFLPQPIGILIGPLIGALIGEYINGKRGKLALKATFGVFVGFLLGTFVKLVLAGYMTILYFKNIF